MLSGKELLIDLIKPALSVIENDGYEEQQLAFDNTELNAFLASFNLPEDILNLSDLMLNKVVSNLEPKEAQTEFAANLKFIKGLAKLSKENDTKLELSKNQLLNLDELKELIEITISQNDYILKHLKEKSDKQIADYRKILIKIQNEELILEDDYDIIEAIVRLESDKEVDSNLDRVMTYINEFNARKLSEIYKEFKEEVEQEPILIEEEQEVVEKIEEEFEEPEIIIDRKLEEIIEPEVVFEGLDVSPMEEPEEYPEDIFNFVHLNRKRKITKLADAEAHQQLKEILAYLGHNYDDLNKEYKEKLMLENYSDLKSFAEFLKEEEKTVFSKIKASNIYTLIYLLRFSNRVTIKQVVSVLKNYFSIGSAGGELFKIVNTATPIFGEEGSQNFRENAKIFKKYNVSIKTIIDKNITFLYVDNELLRESVKLLEKYNADVGVVLEKCNLAIGNNLATKANFNKLEVNIKLLELYGFDLVNFFKEKDACFTMLNCEDLASKIDQFIEVGLNDYIHNNQEIAGNAFKTLLIKRVYYAFKNKMEVWSSSKIEYNRLKQNPLNLEEYEISEDAFLLYKKYIREAYPIITEAEINMMKSDHQILEIIDEGYRPAIYTNTPLTLLKRKTELVLDTQVISRMKFFRVFKILLEERVNEKLALLFALVSNSILEEREFIFIKDVVNKIGVEQ